jgi:hypothetical protein
VTKYTITFEADNDILGQETFAWLFNGIPIPGAHAKSFDDAGYGLAGGYLLGQVFSKDSLGKIASATTNSIYYPPVTQGLPPAKMLPPTLDMLTATEIQVLRSAPPADNGSPIVQYDLRYSTDNATWTEIDAIPTNYTITGLAPSTLYYVQTGAENSVGITWSDSAYASTLATPATTPPGVFVVDGWSISAIGTAGDARLTINTMPDPGSSPILGTRYSINGGALVSLGLSGVGSVDLLDKFTDGAATNVQVLAYNATGDGPLTNPKTVTTYQAAGGTVVNQTATFGQLDRNTATVPAGRYQPVDTAGNIVPITAATYLSGGGLAGRTVVVADGGFGFIGAVGGPLTGTIIRCTHAGGTVDVTCNLHANAKSYAVASYQELYAAVLVADISGGWDVIVRRGGNPESGGNYDTYDRNKATNTTIGNKRVFTGRGTITGEGSWSPTDEYGVGGRSDTLFRCGISVQSPYLKFKNLAVRGAGDTQPNSGIPLNLKGVGTRIIVEDCRLFGDYVEWRPEQASGWQQPFAYAGIKGAGTDHSGLEVRRCLFEFLEMSVTFKQYSGIATIMEKCWCRHIFVDNTKLEGNAAGFAAGVTIRFNYMHGFFDTAGTGANTPHADSIVQFASAGTTPTELSGVSIYGNIVNCGTGGDGNMQAIFGTAAGELPYLHRGPVIVGNLVAAGGSHHCTLNMDNAIIRNNTWVRDNPASANSPDAKATTGTESAYTSSKTGYVISQNNIQEGITGYDKLATQALTPPDLTGSDVILGNMNSGTPEVLAAYAAAFPSYNSGARTDDFTTFINKFRPADPNKGYGANTGITYGLPLQDAGWYIPPALLVP